MSRIVLRADNLDLPDVELALSNKGRRLRFAPVLEQAFEEQRGDDRDRITSRYLIVMLALNLFCLLCDSQASSHMFVLGLLLRLGVFTPATLFAVFVLNGERFRHMRGMASVLPLIVGTGLVVLMARLVPEPLTDRYLLGAAVGIFSQTLIAPVPFPYSSAGLLSSVLVFAVLSLTPWSGHWYPPISPDLPIFIAGLGLSLLHERYRREQSNRRDFLLSAANEFRVQDLQRLNLQLERLSSIDSLTGVFNRRYLDATLKRLWKVAAERERWIAVLMMDIDHFKSLNDSAGHSHGDYCLEHIAQITQQSVRAGIDTVARYGGEEFVAILPDANEIEATAIGERVRRAVEALQLTGAYGTTVTVSVGVAAVKGGASAIALETLMETADQALYEAKHSGRNKLILGLPGVDKFDVNSNRALAASVNE